MSDQSEFKLSLPLVVIGTVALILAAGTFMYYVWPDSSDSSNIAGVGKLNIFTILIILGVGAIAFSMYQKENYPGIVFTIIIGVIIWYFATGGVGQYVAAEGDNLNRQAASRALEVERGYTVHNGSQILRIKPASGPVLRYSEALNNPKDKCLRARPHSSETRPLPPTQIMVDRNHDGIGEWISYTSGVPFYKLRFERNSISGSDYLIEYHIRDQGQCNYW